MTTPEQYMQFGMMVELLMRGPTYRKWNTYDIENRIIRPMLCEQFRVYRAGDAPVGFVTWAWWTNVRGDEFVCTKNVPWGEWNDGTQPWIVDLIAPFGHLRSIVRDLRTEVFPDHEVFSCREHTNRRHRYLGVNYVASRKAA